MTLINNTITETFNNTYDSTTRLLQLSLWPIRIVCPLLIILCPIANWICISIFQSRIYNRSSSKWYFIFIAIFDTIYVLVTAPLIFLITLEIYILNWHILFCKIIVFLNYLSCQISAGLLACLSIDRLVATSYSLLYRYNCTTNISKYVCLFVILIFSLVNSHYLIGYTIDSDGYCSVRHYKWYETNYSRLNVVYLLSYSIIPFTIITICNLFIVISVCHNKSKLRKKYLLKKPVLSITIPNEQTSINLPNARLSSTFDGKEEQIIKHQMFVGMNDIQLMNTIIDPHDNWEPHRTNRLSEKLLLDGEEPICPIESGAARKSSSQPPSYKERSSSTRPLTSSSTYSQKMCVQLQITISLLAISISFIFCTLPNCISTIMIQTYIHDEQIRKIWQAMNYFSIVPLLITHSVNLIFYYLSSSMFRNRFKENYLKKTNSTKQFSLRVLFRS